MRKSVLTFVLGVACSLYLPARASAQPLAVAIPQHQDPLLKNLVIAPDAHTIGMWSPPPASNAQYNWPLVAMHSIVMPDGKVVTFGSPLDSSPFTIQGEVFDIWNPKRGFTSSKAYSHRTLPNALNTPQTYVDSFCAASVLLSTGQLLTSGGNTRNPSFLYNNATSLLSSSRHKASAGTRMASPRYYATQTMLPDGRVLITGGTIDGSTAMFNYQDYLNDPVTNHNGHMSGAPEVYTPNALGGSWDTLSGISGPNHVNPTGGNDAFGPRDNRWWYPRQWVAPDGKVFGLSTHQMWFLDPALQPNGAKGAIALVGTFKSGVGTIAKPNVGATSTAVMYDVGKILQIGGNGRLNGNTALGHEWTPSSTATTVFDINTPGQAQWHDTFESLHFGRQWANATVLADGRVVVTGGTRTGNSADTNDPNGPVLAAEIWNPADESWTDGPSASVPRVYHSSAVLLPNGTVLTAGSGGPPGWTPTNPAQYSAEVYYPSYLFQPGQQLAQRPQIRSMNALKFNYGATIEADVPGQITITKAVLIGLGSTTHSFDMGQRLYPAAFAHQGGTRWAVTAPPNANVAPPGYYYLFLSNSNGVPSEGVIVAIGSNVEPPPRRRPQEFDIDGDGVTDFGIWRPRPYPPAASLWQIFKSSTGNTVHDDFNHGGVRNSVSDVIVPGDYDGDGRSDSAVYIPRVYDGTNTSIWQVRLATGEGLQDVHHGGIRNGVHDIPVPGDYDGDGRSDFAVYIPRDYDGTNTSIWQVRLATGEVLQDVHHGGIRNGVHDIPVPGDYDGDGRSDFAVYIPRDYDGTNTSIWQVRLATGELLPNVEHGGIRNGVPDIPVPGDYDGDGRTDFAVYIPRDYTGQGLSSIWQVRLATGELLPNVEHGGIRNGVPDIPVPGDYDGDGRTDMAVYIPRNYTGLGLSSIWQVRLATGVVLENFLHGGIVDGITDLPLGTTITKFDPNHP
jgi:hypothetical protein